MSKQVITINRTYGSNGRLIGKALSERLNIPFYDKELIELVSQECNIPAKELEKVDEKRANQWHLPLKEAMQMEPQYHFRPMNDVLFDAQSTVIRDLAEKEDCIIVGRCADYVLQEKKNCHRVFIYAPFDYRVQTVIHRLDRNETSAKRLVKKMDKQAGKQQHSLPCSRRLDRTGQGRHGLIARLLLQRGCCTRKKQV